MKTNAIRRSSPNMPASRNFLVRLSLLVFFSQCGNFFADLHAGENPRQTEMVKLVRKCLPAIVSVRVRRKTGKANVFEQGHGGGSVIHRNGIILTNNHVITGAAKIEVSFFQKKWQSATVIAALPQEDMALLRVTGEAPFSALPLGRSNDLELGEPVITFGSPGGLPHSLSAGMVSGLGRSTDTQLAHLPEMLQTTAPISGGSSGGPLINALGELIGMITSRKSDGENLGFAVTIDRIRLMLPKMLAAEQRYGIAHGLHLDPLASRAIVLEIEDESPASQAGLRAGDEILKLNGFAITTAADFFFGLIESQPGDEVHSVVKRGDKQLTLNFRLRKADLFSPASVDQLSPGLRLAEFTGRWKRLPNFDSLQPTQTKVATKTPRIDETPSSSNFGRCYSGYLQVPETGLYTFTLKSDDGSRLWIGDRLAVDNDGMHQVRETAGVIRLQKGFYPLKLSYFDSGGGHSLRVYVSGPTTKHRELPAKWLFHQP